MKWFDSFIYRCLNRARSRDEIQPIGLDEHPKKGRSRLGGAVASVRRVEHNYDDESVITFKVYGANGGMIVETSRYDDKRDNEFIRRYVIDENADTAESIARIVTLEYLR